jgi:ribonuclease R
MHCSATERRADEATRDVVSWLKCFYMQDKVGEEYSGSVSAVVPFGLFVALDDIFIEGLVHISDLGSDYFHFDETRHELAGERTGARYRLSDRVRVQLVRVDLETTKIDFRLIEGASRPTERIGKTDKDRRSEPREALERKKHKPAGKVVASNKPAKAGKSSASSKPKRSSGGRTTHESAGPAKKGKRRG